MAPLGISFLFFKFPASLGSDVVLAGMLNTTQCHQPLPVGASGSNMLTAKLLVAAGAPLQFRAGETLSPLQPKPVNPCSLAIVPPSLISGLVKLMTCASAALTPSKLTPNAAIQIV